MNTMDDQTPEELFKRAVISIFHKWTAINLAVHNEWGGRGADVRRDELIEELFDLMLGGENVYLDVCHFCCFSCSCCYYYY